MCGIAGFLDDRPATRASREAVVSAMTEALRHRGPDDGGVWVDAESGVALGNRRLAIIDVSPAGHQPMASADGRYVIAYNGEVYNHRELAERLNQQGVVLRGHSDTEVLVEGFARWGVAATLRACEGMFALALWDRRQRTLTLIRDRLGIKPLYWGHAGSAFLFGSELKALCRHPDWRPAIDPDSVAQFLRFGYVPAPHSIYRGVHKLEPGMMLTFGAGGDPKLERYWDLREAAADIHRDTAGAADETALLSELEQTLRRAVRNEMESDVPLGAFLSGGIDSSLVTALMQAQSTRPVKTFTIGFTAVGFDEARHAKRVAAHLGTEHTELYVEEREAREVIPSLPTWYDEPFADSSQIPTQIVSRLARQHVTVALSGDGGDELFAGYTRYRWGKRVERAFIAPRALRQGAAGLLGLLSEDVVRGLARMAPARLRPALPEQKAQKLAALLCEDDADAAYRRLVSLWPAPERLVPLAGAARDALRDPALRQRVPNFTERMMLLDTLTYLPDDLLTKVDRASMSVSLEARVPLLNHRVVECAWRLPLKMKLRHGETKWALRRILDRHVPRALIERPKQGFAVPLAAWLRGPLSGWADDLLAADALGRGGWLDPQRIARYWREHRTGERDWSAGLWAVLMFQSWLAQVDAATAAPTVVTAARG
ncbi:MAG TPA: asparagine synthase (glutamine-hydrolyzing) [Stellaceae bacterium]|nr:asparagine synthase (glutamine-hydrolyzing) [Stellaceae bacterium]